ncbi:MAG: hypothetical protein CVT97_09235, partial [Bacteroidetes bacterium HGW-Bacteroidetes-14]
VYPNPASDYLNIVFPENQSIEEICLYDMMGICLFRQKGIQPSGVFTFPVMNLAAGNYMLRIITQDKIVTKSIILK